jgi:dCTP deaminase
MILNDSKIKEIFGEYNLISPFTPTKVKMGASYGLSSYGYDLRLSDKDFKVYRHPFVTNVETFEEVEVDPLDFDPDFLETVEVKHNSRGDYFVIPALSWGLGVALEHITMPNNVIGLCAGKSTYARAGVHVYITPVEPGWKGNLTLEFFNCSSAPVRVYANQGVCQLMLFQGDKAEKGYENGKYQNQTEQVTLAKAI